MQFFLQNYFTYLFLKHDINKALFRFLFLLLLFCKEAGIAFVENKIELTDNNIRIPAKKPGFFF